MEYNAATVNGGYLRGPGTHVVLPGGASSFNGVTTYNSTVFQQNGPANLNNFTNGGQLVNTAALSWNGGQNSITGNLAVSSTLNVADWGSQGVITINSGGALNNSVSDIVFGGGSRTTVNSGGQLNADSDASGIALDLNGGLLVNNGTVSGTTNVYYGSLAQGDGVYGPVNVYNGGTFKPGNSPGSVTTGASTWNPGGKYLVEMNDATGMAGTNWNLWNIDDSLTITAGTASNGQFTIALESENGGSPGLAMDFDPAASYAWPIAETNGASGFDPAVFAVDTSGFSNNLDGGQFNVAEAGNTVELLFTPLATPEPSALALLAAGACGLLAWWRRRRRLG